MEKVQDRTQLVHITPIAILVALGLFCIFVFFYEKHAQHQAQASIDNHARIIADSLWDLSYNNASEYLKLAAASQHYESLVVTDNSGMIFQNINTEKSGTLEQFLIRIHLIPRIKLLAYVTKQGNIIGWIEAVWLPQTIFVHSYVFFAMVLLIAIIHLYTRIVIQKRLLEIRVRKRTIELSRSNRSLKQEVGARMRTEEALRKSEEQHRLLAENISDVIWTMDLKRNFTYISPVAVKLHGWSVEELSMLKIDDVLTPLSLDLAEKRLYENLQFAEKNSDYTRTVTLELQLYRKDGSTFWTEVTTTFMIGKDGKPEGILGVSRDISERRNIQQEKAELQRQLDRSRKMEALGLLAGGVAHDLNNVLSGIVSYPDLILLDLPPESPLVSPLRTIKESGQKAATIVQDLLTLARRGVVSTEIINMNSLLMEYLSSPEHEKLISYHPAIVVETHLEPSLPNIIGSPVHLKKTIMNLVSNAAEAQPQGGLISIYTESRCLHKSFQGYNKIEPGEYAVVRIQDQGEGIAKSDLHRIFEPFYTKKVMGRSGTGLGMAVVWGTMQDHKGYIDIQSTPGKGSLFELYFPITRQSIENKGSVFQLADIKGKGQSILVVDDMAEQREIASNLLQALSYVVETVSSGEDAITYLTTNKADLVILDMIMDPGMDGLETYKRIRELNPDQRVIIASGFAETDRVREAQSLGAGAYIKKPYLIETIGLAAKKQLQ